MHNMKAATGAASSGAGGAQILGATLFAMAAMLSALGTQAHGAPLSGEGAWLHEMAENGVSDAQYEMGVRYASGDGVPLDRIKAASWYRKAAEQGHPEAQNNLGRAYALGEGVTRNSTRAVKWFSRAAEQGLAAAQSNLGALYLNGNAGKSVAQMVLDTYAPDGDHNDGLGIMSLGATLPADPGIEPDISLAVYWLTMAAQQGHSIAYDNLQVALDRLPGRRGASTLAAPPDAEDSAAPALVTLSPEASALRLSEVVGFDMSRGRHNALAWEPAHRQ